MSKSLGNVIDPFEVIDVFGADALRFYLFREVAFGQDGTVSTEGFEQALHDRARQRVGNLANRTHSMVEQVPRRRRPAGRPAPELGASSTAWPTTSAGDRPHRDHAALEAIWKRVRRLNRYVQENEPWKLAKDESAAGRARPGALRGWPRACA